MQYQSVARKSDDSHQRPQTARHVQPVAQLGSKRLVLLESSWAHLFREEILHRLPVEKLFSEFDEYRGRKTKDLYAMLGLILIQQMEDCTDADAVDNFAQRGYAYFI